MLNLSQIAIKLSQTMQNSGEKHQKSNIQCNTPTQSFDNILSLFNMILAPVTNEAKNEAPSITGHEKAETTSSSQIQLTESKLLEFDSMMMEWVGYYQQLQPFTNQTAESSSAKPSTNEPQPVVMSSIGYAMKDVQNELTQWFHSIGGIAGLTDSERNQFIEHVTKLVYEMNGLNERQSNATIEPVSVNEKATTVHEENQSHIGNSSFPPVQQEDIVEKIKTIFGLSKDDDRSFEADNATRTTHNKVVFNRKMEGIRPPLIQVMDSDKRAIDIPINNDVQPLKEYIDPLNGIVRIQNINDWQSARTTNKLLTNRENIVIQNNAESLNKNENTLLMNKSQRNSRIVDIDQTAESQDHQEPSLKEEMKSQATHQSKSNPNIFDIQKNVTVQDEQIPIKLPTKDELSSPITDKAVAAKASIGVSTEMVGETNQLASESVSEGEAVLQSGNKLQHNNSVVEVPTEAEVKTNQMPAEVVVRQLLIHPYQSDKRKIDAQKDMGYNLNPNDATIPPSTQLKSTNSSLSYETNIVNPINESKGQTAPINPDNGMKPNGNPASVDIQDDSQPNEPLFMGSEIHRIQTAKTDFASSTVSSNSVLSLNDFVPEVNEWMGRFFKVTKGVAGSSEAKFKLNPEHLGQLEIKVISQQGQISAQIVTDTALAKEALEAQLSLLKQALQQQGLQVQKLEIVQQVPNSPDVNQGNQSFSQGGSAQQFNQSNEQGSSPSAENGSSHQREDVSSSDYVGIEKEMPSFTYGGASTRTISRIDFTA